MRARILLVDDNKELREFLSDLLTLKDYKIFKAENGTDALRTLAEYDFNLLITDVIMPIMDGAELAHKCNELFPKLKILGMTGGDWIRDAELIKQFSETYFTAFIKKPFDANELLKQVDDMLENN
ncbi:MAG: hypothetical protein COA79_20845 [Planctomycetota bacterium]|nr:MAG: hypothetical protein COA79_20845 [Planctomycetota bacterium]